MKTLMSTTAALAVTLMSGAALAEGYEFPEGYEGKEMTIVSWGGAYTESQDRAYHQPWAEGTGVTVYNEDKAANGLAGIRAQADAGNVTWTLVDMLQSDAQRACDEGLVLEVDHDEWLAPAPDGTPASEDFVDGSLGDCFIPQIVYATMFAYNTEAFPDGGPETIADVWDMEGYPGVRALRKVPNGNLEWALIADGVDGGEVYDVLATDEGQDRAFAKLTELRDSGNLIWWTEGAQPPQMLADKEAVIATAYNGRIFNAQVNENQPFEIMWDRQVFEVDGWAVPAGLDPETEAMVKDYLRFATDSQRLADQAKYISYGPARESSAPLVTVHADTGVEMAPHMPTDPANFATAVRYDPEFWADYGDSLEERFNAWLAQ